ncbi:single-stranded DNA-binding protein, partial [Morganella morganii]
MSAVYKAISNVARDLAENGIRKDRKNAQQGFMFRGIDAVYNALAPALVKHGLVILPRIIERSVTERQTQKGGTLFYVVVKAEFD